jgi:hypothetical protein
MYLHLFYDYLFVSVCIDKLQKNWLSVKCEYVYACLQYGMYLPPVLLALHPILRNLPNKLVHFILDYHPQWVAQLQLPVSDGRH